MTTTKPTTQPTEESGILADTVWCFRQCTRALSGIFSAVHGVGQITSKALGLVSDFASAADNSVNNVHNWLTKPKATMKAPQPQ
jgi:hypothetical protein